MLAHNEKPLIFAPLFPGIFDLDLRFPQDKIHHSPSKHNEIYCRKAGSCRVKVFPRAVLLSDEADSFRRRRYRHSRLLEGREV